MEDAHIDTPSKRKIILRSLREGKVCKARTLNTKNPKLFRTSDSDIRQAFSTRYGSPLLNKLRLQLHRANTVDLAIDIVIAIHQANVLHLGTDLHHQR